MFNKKNPLEAWSQFKGECQHNNEEAKHQNGRIDNTDRLPTAEPCLAIPSQCLHSTPETMSKMEPDSCQPDDVEHYIHRIGKSVFDESETIRRHVCHRHVNQLGKHHVVPEVKQMEQQAQQYNNAQYEHVLRSPFNLGRFVGYCITFNTTGTTVLCR